MVQPAPMQAQAPYNPVFHYGQKAASALGTIALSAGAGYIAGAVFSIINPVGGAIFGATEAVTNLVADGIMDAVGCNRVNNTAFKIAKFVISSVLGAIVATSVVAAVGFPITFTAALALIGGMIVVSIAIKVLFTCFILPAILCCFAARGGVARNGPAAGVNVHAAGRDASTRTAVELLRTATGPMRAEEIEQANEEFLAYLRRQPESPNRTLAERAFIGPAGLGDPFGPLQPDATFTIDGLAISGKEVIARFWRFSNTYEDRAPGANSETERENARLGMVAALTHSYDAFGMVCNPGKVQRLAISVLQGRLTGVAVDQVAVAAAQPPAMTAQLAIAAFWADAHHQREYPNRAALRADANLFIDQNQNMQAFRDDLIRDVDAYAVVERLPNE